MISSLLHLVGLRPRVYYTLTNFRGGARPPCPPQYANVSIFNYLNDRERGALLSFCGILAPPQCPPPTIPKYFTILMTEVRDAIIFVGFLRPPPPPNAPSPDAIILIYYLNNRERGAPYILCRILRPPPQCPPPPDAGNT